MEQSREQQMQAAGSVSKPSSARSSQRPSAARRSTQNSDRNAPIHTRLTKGQVPGDGNCFLHSLKVLAGDRLAQTLKMPAEWIEPVYIRRHVASRVIDLLRACRQGPLHEAAVMAEHEYLTNLSTWDPADGPMLNMRNSTHRNAFLNVLGPANAQRCADFTPEQQTHIYNIARDHSWSAATGDTMAPATAAAFPGLRLSVITPTVTPATVEQYTFGEGTAKPCLLFLEDDHYVPAFDGADQRRR